MKQFQLHWDTFPLARQIRISPRQDVHVQNQNAKISLSGCGVASIPEYGVASLIETSSVSSRYGRVIMF